MCFCSDVVCPVTTMRFEHVVFALSFTMMYRSLLTTLVIIYNDVQKSFNYFGSCRHVVGVLKRVVPTDCGRADQ